MCRLYNVTCDRALLFPVHAVASAVSVGHMWHIRINISKRDLTILLCSTSLIPRPYPLTGGGTRGQDIRLVFYWRSNPSFVGQCPGSHSSVGEPGNESSM